MTLEGDISYANFWMANILAYTAYVVYRTVLNQSVVTSVLAGLRFITRNVWNIVQDHSRSRSS